MEIAVAFFAACMVFYAFFIGRNAWWFARIPCEKVPPNPLLPPATIIIPARNEAENLSKCLYKVVHQAYPKGKLEVILVNDHSTDGTLAIAQLMESRYPNLKVLSLPDKLSGKKAALSYGIENANGEIILQTDADCVVQDHWAKQMVAHFKGNTGLVVGPIELFYDRNSKFERFQALEAMGLTGITAGSIASGYPNMCNGANLAYRKEVFHAVKGFEGVDQVASGDDELLMQKIQKHGDYAIQFAKCREAIVATHALTDWESLKKQRLRWVSKARAYINKRINFVQLISYFAFLGLPFLLISSFFMPMNAWLALELFALKLIADFYLMHRTLQFFHKLPLLSYLLPLQMVYIPYVLWIGIAGNFVKKYNWKGRWVQ
ncbi:MAG: glycosyltransferase [Bacteroidia bacterium]|nr:glycosyltransferase [Bacteroidia bacterium]